jgi:hypothetical protein
MILDAKNSESNNLVEIYLKAEKEHYNSQKIPTPIKPTIIKNITVTSQSKSANGKTSKKLKPHPSNPPSTTPSKISPPST